LTPAKPDVLLQDPFHTMFFSVFLAVVIVILSALAIIIVIVIMVKKCEWIYIIQLNCLLILLQFVMTFARMIYNTVTTVSIVQ
jgi:hypothetical protein